jgi:hypothetical protein
LDFLNDLRTPTFQREIPARVTFRGAILVEGVFLTKDFDGMFSGVVVGTDFLEAIKDRMLNDFDFGADVDLGTSQTDVANFAKNYHAGSGVGFPEIFNPEYFGGSEEAFGGILNARSQDGANGYINTFTDDDEANDNVYSLLPCFRFYFLLEKIAAGLGYTFTGSFFGKPEIDELLLVGSKTLDEFGGIQHQGVLTFSDTLLNDGEFSPIGNRTGSVWNGSKYVVQAEGSHRIEARLNYRGTDPTHATRWIYGGSMTMEIDGVEHRSRGFQYKRDGFVNLNVTFEAGPDDLGKTFQMRFNAYRYIEDPGIPPTEQPDAFFAEDFTFRVYQKTESELNVFKKSMAYREHLPEVTLGDFLKDLATTFNLALIPKYNEIEFVVLEDLLTSKQFDDYSDRVVRKLDDHFYSQIQIPERNGFTLTWTEKKVSDERVVGNGKKTVKFNLSAMGEHRGFAVNEDQSDSRFMYSAEWQGNTFLEDDDGKKTPLRMAFHDYLNAPISLRFGDSATDFSKLFLNETFSIRNRAVPVVFMMDLNINQILNFDVRKKFMVGNQVFIVNKITTPFSDQIGISRVECWQI